MQTNTVQNTKHLFSRALRHLDKALPAVVLCAMLAAAPGARAGFRSWTGASGSGYWSEPSNWTPTGPPQTGDALIFPHIDTNSPGHILTNDVANLVLDSMTFNGYFDIFGDVLSLSNGITVYNTAELPVIYQDVIHLVNPQGFVAHAGLEIGALDVGANELHLTVDGGVTLELRNYIWGSGTIRTFGDGTVLFLLYPITSLPYQGQIFHTARFLDLDIYRSFGTNTFSGFTPTQITVGVTNGSGPYEIRWLQSHALPNHPALTLYQNGLVNLNNNNEDFGAVTFNSGTVDSGPSGQFAIYQPLTVNPAAVSAIIIGNLGLPACCDGVFIVGDGPADCDLVVSAQIFGGAPYLRKQGPGKMCLTAANTYSGVTLLQDGILYVNTDGGLSSAGAVIFDGATLQLDGTDSSSTTLANNFEMVGAGFGGRLGALQVLHGASLTGSILLDAATTLNVTASDLVLNGAIGGTGPLTKIGAGSLTLGGPSANTFSGDTIALASALILAKPFGVAAVPGNLVLGPASASTPAFAQFNNSAQVAGTNITVNANSTLNLSGQAQALTQLILNDGGSVPQFGYLRFAPRGAIMVGSKSPSGSHVHSAISGNIQIAPNDTLTFTVNPYAVFFPFDTAPELDVPATIYVDVENTQLVPAGIGKEGAGRMRLGGVNTYKGNTTVNGGTLQADGSQPQSAVVVNSGAQVQGAGMVGPIYLNGSSAVLAPGDGLGILTSSNFDRGGGSGVLAIQLNGTTLGTGYNQLDAIGSVTLTGVTLSAQLNYPSAVNDQFTIINNDRSDAVIGTFNGLPQNSTLYIGGQLFQISYTGGNGNDVVLNRIPTPTPPTLTIQSFSSSSLVLSWPTNGPAFTLQVSTNLTSSNWTSVSSAPVIVGTNYVVTNATPGPQGFYRLIH
jgi:autotransporter-associated beta strand protein